MEKKQLLKFILDRGAMIGCIYFACTAAGTLLTVYTSKGAFIAGCLSIAALVLYIWLLCRACCRYREMSMSMMEEPKFFSYGMSLSFFLGCGLLTGVVTGLGQYILISLIGWEQYIDATTSNAAEALSGYNVPSQQMDQFYAIMDQMRETKRPGAISSVINQCGSSVFLTGLVGLVASFFIKKSPVIFGGENKE